MIDLIKNVIEFVAFTVILKMIVAHWLADRIVHYGGIWFSKTERNFAIWSHYQLRAVGDGHGWKNIVHCTDGKCKTL